MFWIGNHNTYGAKVNICSRGSLYSLCGVLTLSFRSKLAPWGLCAILLIWRLYGYPDLARCPKLWSKSAYRLFTFIPLSQCLSLPCDPSFLSQGIAWYCHVLLLVQKEAPNPKWDSHLFPTDWTPPRTLIHNRMKTPGKNIPFGLFRPDVSRSPTKSWSFWCQSVTESSDLRWVQLWNPENPWQSCIWFEASILQCWILGGLPRTSVCHILSPASSLLCLPQCNGQFLWIIAIGHPTWASVGTQYGTLPTSLDGRRRIPRSSRSLMCPRAESSGQSVARAQRRCLLIWECQDQHRMPWLWRLDPARLIW